MKAGTSRYRLLLIRTGWLAFLIVLTWGLLYVLGNHTTFFHRLRGMHGSIPPVGTLLEPYHGLWYTARTASHSDQLLEISALKEPVTIVRDERGVPHIFAETERDAVIATGYVVAQDRLFQLDFIPRAAAGRLAEVFGPGLVKTDRYLRSTGMEWAARMNMDSIRVEDGITNDLLTWFAAGVNAHIESLDEHQLPIEFRLLGYRPNRYEPINGVRVQQYMAFDLSFPTDAAEYGRVRRLMNEREYWKLFPREAYLYEPIVPEPPDTVQWNRSAGSSKTNRVGAAILHRHPDDSPEPGFAVTGIAGKTGGDPEAETLLPRRHPGKGSNNWAVTGRRSESGGAILAGDMHLDLTMPAIWYEIHVVAPGLNAYGVLIPGSPLPVEAFNERHGWTFTNTGADQIDHYRIVLDSTGTAYRFNEKWLPFELAVDTIRARGAGAFPDTMRFTRFGPIMGWPDDPIAIQWTAHKRARTLRALWNMHRAQGPDEFQRALRFWDSPAQNILYADTAGNIAIRSTGYLPVRKSGNGAGLLDGTAAEFDWIGRIPFDELPYSENPEQQYLASANQQPVGDWYPYYLGHDWYRSYRSLRINQLLREKPGHDLWDMMEYQSDVHVIQRDLFVPMMDSAAGLSEDARFLKRLLLGWDGEADLEQSATLVLDEYLRILERLVWDEFDKEGVRRPRQVQLYRLLAEDPDSPWLDIQSTDLKRETASDLVGQALEETADTMRARYGWDERAWRWDRHHTLLIRHLTRSGALSPLDVGPLSFPGFANTLSSAPGRVTTNAASWKMIVDFSDSRPTAFGIYPGGQSGNPFSIHYADFVPMFVHFGYYRLARPESADRIESRNVRSTLRLTPVLRPPHESD